MQIIRGAVFAENTVESISENSVKLIGAIMEKNNLSPSRVVGVFFTATDDLDACNPATAVRLGLKLDNTAFMCSREMNVKGMAKKCLRAAVFAETDEPVKHCYLGEAAKLRSDLS